MRFAIERIMQQFYAAFSINLDYAARRIGLADKRTNMRRDTLAFHHRTQYAAVCECYGKQKINNWAVYLMILVLEVKTQYLNKSACGVQHIKS